MKVIEKKQQGGGMPAFVSYTDISQPQPTAPYTTQSQQSSGEEQEGILDKNMVKFLYENGIPSDVEAFIEKSGIFSSGLHSNPFRKSDTTLQYKTILKMLPKIKAESERFKQAMAMAEKNDGLGEIAVTDGGYVITADQDGSLNKKAMSEVDLTKEKILTNSELANYRANDVNAAFSTDITSIISNGVGIPKITEYIKTISDKLGTSSTTSDGYVSQQAGRVLKGLEYLKSLSPSASEVAGMSLDGVYKVSGMDKNQAQQAQQAINYIMFTLPKNMRTVLQAKAATTFGDNSQEGVRKLVMMLTSSALKGEHSFTLDFKENLDPSTGKKTSKGGNDDNIIDPAKGFVLGLGDKQMYTINNGNSYNLNLYGNKSVITDKSGKPMGNATLADINKSTFAGALDLENATMGSQTLGFAQMDRVALNGSSIVGVDLPLDLEAKSRGITRPDLDALKRLETAEETIRNESIVDPSEKNKVYAANNLPFKYDNAGNINLNSYARFGVLSAYADESAFMEDAALDDSLSEVVDENERRGIERTLKAADKDYKVSSGGWFGLASGTHLYSGSVYIPIVSNMLNTAWGSGNYPTLQGNDAAQIEARQQNKLVEEGYQKPAPLSSLLN